MSKGRKNLCHDIGVAVPKQDHFVIVIFNRDLNGRERIARVSVAAIHNDVGGQQDLVDPPQVSVESFATRIAYPEDDSRPAEPDRASACREPSSGSRWEPQLDAAIFIAVDLFAFGPGDDADLGTRDLRAGAFAVRRCRNA